MAQILDYSAGYPGAAAIRAAGYAGVIRYLRKEGTSRVRPITAAELADLRAHGLDVALVYQTISTARILEGYAAGAHDARWALQQAAAIGVPGPRAIYFAADQDIDATELPKVLAYLDGAASVLGRERVGIYGEASVVDTALPDHATWGWQTAAWSGGRRAARAHLYQRIGQILVGGISCDVNGVLKADYGQGQEEDDMATPQEIAQAVWAHPITFQADPQNPGGPADVHLGWANWCSQEGQKILLQQRATLAALLAGQQDDVSDTDVLERLEQAMGVEIDRLRAELVAAREADRVAMVAAVRDTVPTELADQVVTRLGERLAPVALLPGGGA